MRELIKRSYKAIVKRGLINKDTRKREFLNKIIEEYNEVVTEFYAQDEKKYIEELTDLATVCIMQIHHKGYDFVNEFEKVIIKNETRLD